MKKILILGVCLSVYFTFTWGQTNIGFYAGTAMPYPSIKDSSVFSFEDIKPFYINHLGRHGARFPTSGKALNKAIQILTSAEHENRLTPEGTKLLSTMHNLVKIFQGHWGKLSQLGEQEQKGIAGRMIKHHPLLFTDTAQIEAIATSVPRCINSMDVFLEVINQHNPYLHIIRSEGHQYDTLLRFFDLNKAYVQYKTKGDWIPLYEEFLKRKISSVSIINKFFFNAGQNTEEENRQLAMALFAIAAILPDTGIPIDLGNLFTPVEWSDYWQTQNLRQYLSKSAAPIGKSLPVATAKPLLQEFIRTAEEVINGQSYKRVNLRFAHAETVIPFAALMGIDKTDTTITNPDSVASYWKDYEIAPMAANVQWIFYRDKKQQIWIKILLNEKEAALPIPTDYFPYYSWPEVRRFFTHRIHWAQKILTLSENPNK